MVSQSIADRYFGGNAVGHDSGYRVTATVVLAENLTEKSPDGGDGVKQAVAESNAVFLECIEDAEFAQGVGERQSLVACKASADLF